MQPPPPTLNCASSDISGKFRVGTLVYSTSQLITVFFWLLWGDFCLTLMDGGVVANVLNDQLKVHGVSKSTIGFLTGTTIALMSAVLVSVIATTSDRHRGPLGRRMPFLLYSAPLVAAALLLLGFSPRLAIWLHETHPGIGSFFSTLASWALPGTSGMPTKTLVILGVLSITLLVYTLFDLFPQSIYYPLWADVVPSEKLGLFACLFRIVSALGMFVFNRFIFSWATTHPEWLYVGAGMLYLVSFVLMALVVKEGTYPPPPAVEVRTGTMLDSVIQYCRDCYTTGYYWKFFLMSASFILAIKSLNKFVQFFGTETLALSNQAYGELMSWKDLFIIVPFVVLAPFIDRLHPLRAGLAAATVLLGVGIACFAGIHGEVSFGIWITLLYVAIATYQAATGAIGPKLLPREHYGRFNSAGSMVFQFGWALAAWLCGVMLDSVGDYRYLFLWFSGFVAFGLAMMFWLYRDWLRLGGDKHYQPPLPSNLRPPPTPAGSAAG